MKVLLLLILFTYSLASANNCTLVSIKDGDTCYNLWTDNGMTKETFNSANPTINCQNLQVGQTVCIIPDPLLPGQYRDEPSSSACQKLYSIKSGDTCQTLWLSNSLNETAFMSSNPGINCRNLQVGQKVCLHGYLPDTSTHQYDPYQTTTSNGINSSINPSTQPSYSTPTPYYDPYPSRLPYSGGNVQSNNNSTSYISPVQYQQSQNSPHSSQLITSAQQSSHIQTVPYQQAQTQTQDQQPLYQPQQQVQSSPQAQQTFYEPQQTQYQPQVLQSSYQPQNSQSSSQTQVQQTQQSQYHPQTSQSYYQPQAQQTQYQPQTENSQYQPQLQQIQYQPQSQNSQYPPQTQPMQYQPQPQPQPQQSQYQFPTQQSPVPSQQPQYPSQFQYQPSTQNVQYQPQLQHIQYESQNQPSVLQQKQYQPTPTQNQYQPSAAQAQTPQLSSVSQYGVPVSEYQSSYQPSVGQSVQQLNRPSYDSSSDTKVNETCRIHTIKLGDTCFDIWSANGMTQSEFSQLNPNVNCQTLQLGQQVCTDPNTLRPGQYRDDSSCQKLYSIKAGDTCANLWQTNGITEQHFMQRNTGINCNNLQIGQDICLS